MLEISDAENRQLGDALESSVAAFAAVATTVLQRRDAGCTTAKQLRQLMTQVMQPESSWKLRDTARVAEVVRDYREAPGPLAIYCANPDTRLWLARALQIALEQDWRPHHGAYAVRANPTKDEAGEIIVVAPGDPMATGYPRSLVF